MSHVLRPLAALALLASAGRAGVIRVPGDYLHVQVAVNNAVDGDLILVAPGNYPDAIDVAGKSLAIVADGGTATFVGIRIHDLSEAQGVVLRGISGKGAKREGLVIEDCAGRVVVEDGSFTGGNGSNFYGDPNAHASGWHGVVVDGAHSVDITRSTLKGGEGSWLDEETVQGAPGSGGSALSASGSDVGLHECSATAGSGGSITDTVGYGGGSGGHGARVASGQLYAAGCSFTGKSGGSADCSFFSCGSGGGGGSGVYVAGSPSPATLWSLDCDLAFGSGGSGGCCSTGGAQGGSDGLPGKPITVEKGGTRHPMPDPLRTLRGPQVTRELHPLIFKLTGQPGDVVFAWVSATPDWLMLPAYGGPLLVDRITFIPVPLGTVPASGTLDSDVFLVDLGPGVDEVTVLAQGVFVASGKTFLGSASAITLLDSSF